MKRFAGTCFAVCALFGSLRGAPETPLPFYELPRVWPAHVLLRTQLMQCVRAGEIAKMEEVCRQGLKLMPGDPVWHYNLACALAYRQTPDAALDELSRAVRLGFRDADTIAADNDLKRIASHPKFAEIVRHARETADLPPPGAPLPATLKLTAGTSRVLHRENLAWDYDRGFFVANFTFLKGLGENAEALAAAYRGPARDLVRTWLADGTAAGNAGDLYVNRDGNHSTLGAKRKDFPLLSEFSLEADAKKAGADRAIPNTFFPQALVIGNASLAIVTTNGSFSLPRIGMLDGVSALRLGSAALENQFWIFPANSDFDDEEASVDRFPAPPANCLATKGISRSDLPFVRAAAAAAAAFTPATKDALRARKLFAPTLQYLFRRTRTGVADDADYLTAQAHPVAFDRESLDAEALVTRAHALKPETLPPCVLPFARHVAVSENDVEREGDFTVTAWPADAQDVTFAWRLIRGDASRVTIKPSANGAKAHVTVRCLGLTNRLDIAVFAKTPSSPYGAPAFVSFGANRPTAGN